MFRTVAQFTHPRHPRPIIEKGPWHGSRQVAEQWAAWLRMYGYEVTLESQPGLELPAPRGNSLAAALANMA